MIFTGKQLCWGLFFNKVAGHQSCNFITRRLQHRYFLVNIENFLVNIEKLIVTPIKKVSLKLLPPVYFTLDKFLFSASHTINCVEMVSSNN